MSENRKKKEYTEAEENFLLGNEGEEGFPWTESGIRVHLENAELRTEIKKLQDNIMIINETMKAYALKLEELADRK